MSTTLYTIGYEKARQGDLVATLKTAGVEILIDVRDRPISRRPGFSKSQLTAACAEAGIRYVHLRALGTPPEGREAAKKRDWDRFDAIVEAKLATPEAEHALHDAVELAGEKPSCLLCLEADWHHCHRRRVAELMVDRSAFEIEHLSVAEPTP